MRPLRRSRPGLARCQNFDQTSSTERAARFLHGKIKSAPSSLGKRERPCLKQSARRCAGRIFKYFAGEAVRLEGERLESVRAGIEIEIIREPEGVIGIITPWNFPIAIPACKIAPALAYGNTVVFKPADLVPGCAWILPSARRPESSTLSWPGLGSRGRNRQIGSRSCCELYRVRTDRPAHRPRSRRARKESPARARREESFDSCRCCRARPCCKRRDQWLLLLDWSAMYGLKPLDRLSSFKTWPPKASRAPSLLPISMNCRSCSSWEALATGPISTLGVKALPSLRRASVIRVKDYEEAVAVANQTEFGLASGICTSSLKLASDFKRRSQSGMVMVNVPRVASIIMCLSLAERALLTARASRASTRANSTRR